MSDQKERGLGVLDLVMLGFGSVIGAGLFVASGNAVREAGPAVLVAFAICGVAFYGVLSGLGEMAAVDPAPGGLRTYARRAFGPWIGFTVGWMYFTSGMFTMSSEVTAAALLGHFWLPFAPLWALSLVFSVIITGINFMDPRGFGKVESGLAVIKVLALVAFIGIGAWFLVRGAGAGLATMRTTGLFPTGVRGIWASLLMVMFTYAGVQVVAMAGPDTRDAARTIPRGMAFLTVSVLLLYLTAFVVLLLVLPWNQVGAESGPFVQALRLLGLTSVNGIFNLVILTAALSSLNSALYSVSRMLYSLALDGQAPRIFLRRTRYGVPGMALAASAAVLLGAVVLAFLLPRSAYLLVTSASGSIAMFNWTMIALAHIRYRPILLKNRPEGLPYRAPGYPYLSWVTAGIALFVLVSGPLAPGQGAGIVVFAVMFGVVSLVYWVAFHPRVGGRPAVQAGARPVVAMQEVSESLAPEEVTAPQSGGENRG